MKKLTIDIEDTMQEDLKLAMLITGDTEEEAILAGLKKYICQSLQSRAMKYKDRGFDPQQKREVFGKAIGKIPLWAHKADQTPHKIIKAFLMLKANGNTVTKEAMRELCSDQDNKNLFVDAFISNFAQMKRDDAKSYGRIFEEREGRVEIWDEVKSTLMKYKGDFLKD